MLSFDSPSQTRRDGVTLVIVLAMVVLLTGLIVAFFSRSILDRQISTSSANRIRVDAFARGAADTIVGDLKQEILNGSSITSTNGVTLYTPATLQAAVPQLNAPAGDTFSPNLVKLGLYNQPFYSGSNGSAAIPSGVIAVSSTTPSLNNRLISPARWNAHYLLPFNGATDATPTVTASNWWTPPSWVLVARDGSNPALAATGAAMQNYLTNGANPVLGRYAYAVYNEGGLLDVNAAGYPSTSGTFSK